MRAEFEQVIRDPVVYAAYLLYAEARGCDPKDIDVLVNFACWLIFVGRRELAHPAIIPNRIVDWLTQPDASGKHALLNFVASMRPEQANSENLNAFYYGKILSLFQLGRFLGPSDFAHILTQSQSTPQFAGEEFRLLLEVGRNSPSLKLPSISIVGFHRSVLGIGEDARNLFRCLSSAGIAAELVDLSPPILEKSEEVDAYRLFESSKPSGEVIIFCMPPFEMMRAIGNLGLEASRKFQYRIGLWPWETTHLHEDWLLAYYFVHEIWAMSHFLEDVFRARSGNVPVVYVPPSIIPVSPRVPDELATLFDANFCFLSIFDFNSRIERKNPLGTIAAFKLAFPRERDVRLILKTLNQEKHPEHFSTIMEAIGADERILVIDGPLPQSELYGLISLAGAYISLHRSEGFGRPLVEAMHLGVPVIATQWSGSADYLDDTTGYPVGSMQCKVPRDNYPFAAGNWAEPDLEQAAELFREVFQGSEAVEIRCREAQARVARQYSPSAASRLVVARLQKIAKKL
jgi:glycosyltransferase involved in cell wall biosynthesis